MDTTKQTAEETERIERELAKMRLMMATMDRRRKAGEATESADERRAQDAVWGMQR